MIEEEERRAIGMLLDLEYLFAEYYTWATTGSGLSSDQRGLDAGPVAGGRKVKFGSPIVAAFSNEAANAATWHIGLLRQFQLEIGERPYRASSLNLETGFASMARRAAIVGHDRPFDVFADELNFLLGAFMLEDVGLTVCTHALRAPEIKWSRDLLVGLLGSLASRTAIVRAFLYAAGLSSETQALAVLRQRTCGLFGTDYQANDRGVGDRHTSTMMPVDGRALAWGRTLEQGAAILGAAGRVEDAFFPAGINAMLRPASDIRRVIPVYFSEFAAGRVDAAIHVISSFPSEHVNLPAIDVDVRTFDVRENTPHQPWTETAYASWAPSCLRIPNAILHGAVGIVGVGRHAIKESLWHTESRRHRYDEVDGQVRLDLGIVEPLDGTTVSILVGAAESYWHTLIDSVARLTTVPDAVWPTVDRILYPSTGVRLAELLDLFGLPASVELREVRPCETFDVHELIQPSSLHGHFDYHPNLLRETFSRLKAGVDLGAKTPSRIFIDRRASPLRRLTNEDDIIAALPDFVPVQLEALSVAEQVRLFANADIIIAPHGAGLTNIGFSRPGTVVVELMMDSYCNWCYRRMAAFSHLHYRFVMGRRSDPNDLGSIHFSKWTIDRADVLREIEAARSLVAPSDQMAH